MNVSHDSHGFIMGRLFGLADPIVRSPPSSNRARQSPRFPRRHGGSWSAQPCRGPSIDHQCLPRYQSLLSPEFGLYWSILKHVKP
jgi:hypothetical protein